ncbi:MAG: DUF420 domain-containing protein [Myxococcota bacterium]
MFPPGFFGTRADLLMDVILVATLSTPFILAWAISLAKKGQHQKHRVVQVTLLVVLLLAVGLFETEIRLSGGSGSLMKGSSYAGTWWLRGILLAHVLANVVTFFTWLVLVFRSGKRFGTELPGAFTPSHRRVGKLVFAGTVFGAVSALIMYVLGFVL